MKIERLEEIKDRLDSRFAGDLITRFAEMPQPSTMHNLLRAADQIEKSHRAQTPITIVGDYDADGVCASAILSSVFDQCGVAHQVIIPDRFTDGYGLSPAIIDRIDEGLIITVDNGISANEAAIRAKAKNLELIITDHHVCPEVLPDALIVNPKQSACGFAYDDICGALVAWYLAVEVRRRLNPSVDTKELLALVAIATIADSMPLVGLNRFVAQAGLEMLNRTQEPFALAFRAFFNKQTFSYDDIGFFIAPRINAAGRIASAKDAFEFLKSTSTKEAEIALYKLENYNQTRKELESVILDAASDQASFDDPAVVVYGEDWHEGVIGIVASRLAERFKKPAVVISINGEIAKASARTVGDVDLYSLIRSSADHLLGFGGHKKAAGFSLKRDKITDFKSAFFTAASLIAPDQLLARDELLGELNMALLDTDLYDLIAQYEPFGEGNPRPEFVSREMIVASYKTIGKESNHLKLQLKTNAFAQHRQAIRFFANESIEQGKTISFYYSLLLNEFGGRRTVEMKISEFC